ncbi:MAG TPA: energy transducer TonB [Pyrinomonadaceae bacterium]
MFANLVESNSHKGDYARSGKFFLATLSIYALAFLAIGVGSIYAYNAHFDNNNLELTSLVTPVDTTDVQMIRIRPAAAPTRPANAPSSSSNVAVVRTPPTMVTTDISVAPHGVSVEAPRPELPVGMNYRIGIPSQGDNLFGGPGDNRNGGGGTGMGNGPKIDELVRETPPPAMPKETRPPAQVRTISKGVVNGSAIDLPKPTYSAIARAAHAFGTVTVQVLIDESGKVVSAHALSGHPLLQEESVRAAYRARFSPTLLSNQPVKVSGMITYNFVMQ